MNLNRQAWALLKEDEQIALNLHHGQDKSTWEAGEIMEKAHYKLLEIKYRGEHFLKIFTEHFNLYDQLIPEQVEDNIPSTVKVYLRLVMNDRKKPKEAYTEMDVKKKSIDKELIKWVLKHSDSEDLYMLNFVNLVKEFDRWNNFRVLPRDIQEPSAYKRRNKTIDRKRVKLVHSMPEISLKIIQEVCCCKSNTGYWVGFLVGKKKWAEPVKKRHLDKLSGTGIYIFDNKALTLNYLDVIDTYLAATTSSSKSCKQGLKFWPEYREIITKAVNYNQVQKIFPSRKFLAMALSKLEFHNQKK